MNKPKDSAGSEIHLTDILSRNNETYVVIGILSDELVHLQPTERGTPELCKASEFTIKSSLYRDILSLTTQDEFLNIINGMELRFTVAVNAKSERKGRGKGKKTANVSVEMFADFM